MGHNFTGAGFDPHPEPVLYPYNLLSYVPLQQHAHQVPRKLGEALVRMGLAGEGESIRGTPMTGGVSSDIWRIDLASGPVCIKRALPKLKVDAEWRVPVERNSYEVAWMRRAASIVPGAVPPVLGEDRQSRAFAMRFLTPDRYPMWKAQLLAADVDVDFAARVGAVIGRIHAATADRPALARAFATDANFHAIRLEPYLLAAAAKHPDLSETLTALAKTTATRRRVLVHGDVSPKNILAGPEGPVFLDAECAWFGDPAFDAAFCLNHLLLKSVVLPDAREALRESFDAFCEAYLAATDWEPTLGLEARIARLLPGLSLARVDGKSPVEYLDTKALQDTVRRAARTLLQHPPDRLADVRHGWARELGR